MTIETIIKTISKLPHSTEKVPWDYHYDYIRDNNNKFLNRREIREMNKENYLELHIASLKQLIDEMGSETFIYIDNYSDLHTIKFCIEYCENIILPRYNTES